MIAKLRALASGAGILTVTRFAGAGIGFLTQVLLAKLLGAHDLGIFYAATSLAAVAGIVAAQGYPQIAARFAARYRNRNAAHLFGAFGGQATRDALLAAIFLALTITAWAFAWPSLESDARLPYALGGLMVIAVALTNLYTNIAGGMRRFVLCYVPEGLIRPIGFFLAVAAAGLAGFKLSALDAVALFAVATAIVSLTVYAATRAGMPPLRFAPSSRGLAWRWRREAWLLVLLAVFTNFFADIGILMVVPFLPSSGVAVFGLCLKLALLVGYFVQIAQQMAVPDIADARHTGDGVALRRAVWRSIAMPLALTLASLVAVIAFGGEMLALFGPQFTEGRTVLVILVATQVLRALAGPSAHLMTLRGAQGLNAALSAGAIAILFLSNMVLIAFFGLEGAGFAVFVTYGLWLLATAVALRRLGEARVDGLALLSGPAPLYKVA